MSTENQKTVSMFCANEQAETEHTVEIDGNGEIVLTCECGRFIKLPEGTDAEGLKTFVQAHKEANEGQRSVESIEKAKEELLAGL